jgi:hypothetical protein
VIPCVYKYFFNIECPGCGFQRSLNSLLHFDIVQSFYFFPGLFPFLVFMIVEAARMLGIKQSELKYHSRFFGFTALFIQLGAYLLRFYGVIPWTCDI